MKRTTYILIFMIFITSIVTINNVVNSLTKSDYQIVTEYCDMKYPHHTILIFTEWDEETMLNRMDTDIVYVEKCETISQGKYGLTSDGCYVAYNTEVKKGKKVISFFVYNPYTNYSDDIVAVVDNQKIR